MKKSIIVETEIFLVEDINKNKTDEEIVEDFLKDEDQPEDQEIVYSSKFIFDFSDVLQVNQDYDKCILRFLNDNFVVKMDYDEACRLFCKSRGVEYKKASIEEA